MVSDFTGIVVEEFDLAVALDELDFESLLQATAPSVSDAVTIRLPMILMDRDGM
jgi:hypothetical protein